MIMTKVKLVMTALTDPQMIKLVSTIYTNVVIALMTLIEGSGIANGFLALITWEILDAHFAGLTNKPAESVSFGDSSEECQSVRTFLEFPLNFL